MPSYISNSNDRAPNTNSLKTWVLTMVIALTLLTSTEVYWRNHGHHPTIVDDKNLWSFHREQVYSTETQKAVVLVGKSRIQMGVDTQLFRETFPKYKLIQLAIPGQAPLATLRDLAFDRKFNGVVICSTKALQFMPRYFNEQKFHIEHYYKYWNLNTKVNRIIATWFQEHLVLLSPNLKLTSIIDSFFNHSQPPKPSLSIIHNDRSGSVNFQLIDNLQIEQQKRANRVRTVYKNKKTLSPKKWLSQAKKTNLWVKMIQKRGGQVAFVRFPTSGDYYKYDELTFPKKDYWDKFSAQSPGITIHFMDYSTLSHFTLPDLSHLDMKDKSKFTKELLTILKQKKVL
ncbi:MAG: hypothetical protein GQ532_04375 [Methylomarinum sp.]|nr:hypothetical protein [Methylomarinum sp.]